MAGRQRNVTDIIMPGTPLAGQLWQTDGQNRLVPIDITGIVDADAVVWDSSTGLWHREAQSGGGGGGGSAGGLVLLESRVASGGSSLDFTTRNATGQSGASFQSDFDEYVWRFGGLVFSVDGAAGYMRFSSNGGSSWVSSAVYSYSTWTFTRNATGNYGSEADSGYLLFNFVAADAGWTTAGTYFLSHPMATGTNWKNIYGTNQCRDANRTGAASQLSDTAGIYYDSAAANAVQLFASSGVISAGEGRLYGVSK